MSYETCPSCSCKMLDSEECQHCEHGREPVDSVIICKVVITRGDTALIILRSKTQRYPNRWDLPGGHIHIGEGIEGATRLNAAEAWDLVQGSDDDAAAVVECLAHLIDGILRAL